MQDVSEDAQLKNNTQLPFKEVKSGFTYFEKGDVLLAKITLVLKMEKDVIPLIYLLM
ncbi:Uncharacterised protein [Escherichia coli]|uniref:Uncharacterized protein n=1 Tax=Escherichia coli TaxID=562 RepID=A0A376ZU95_ECOLX|nr:Uncharacterised protein [Escherichia coli]